MTSNQLKIMALICMIVDHIGYYFDFILPPQLGEILRIIGRISMPIFVFLLVQGYLHTKNISKYLIRLGILAFITQFFIWGLASMNKIYLPGYISTIGQYLNILCSFVLTLIILICIDKKLKLFSIPKKEVDRNAKTRKINTILEIIIRIFFIGVILICYHVLLFDYGMVVPGLGCCFYFAEKIKEKSIPKSNMIYNIILIITLLLFSLISNKYQLFSLLCIPFLLLYNGKLGKKSKKLQLAFYAIFPLQHLLLYLLAMFTYSSIL